MLMPVERPAPRRRETASNGDDVGDFVEPLAHICLLSVSIINNKDVITCLLPLQLVWLADRPDIAAKRLSTETAVFPSTNGINCLRLLELRQSLRQHV
jgi:hypothetical protein